MIAPALLIKILGFAAVGAVLVVGVPLIVKSEKEKADAARQEEIE